MSDTSTYAASRPWAGMGADYVGAMERAESLVPALRERAAMTDELRRLPQETERELHAAGLFRIMQPRRSGGLELDYVSLIDVGDILARGDASVA
jgi:3-hydroxy-9,10-secoandrosta-1,3,5(10)-triene-9,17-dione monooxygenase